MTIEAKTLPQQAIREAVGDWFFGCDLCQTVCPWNHKAFGREIHEAPQYIRQQVIVEIRHILGSSNKGLLREFAGSPLSRAGANGLKRNAMVVAANKDLDELAPDIARYLHHRTLGELADWALKKMSAAH